MKIYTRTGDTGTTALFGGERVPKDHHRIEAYGTLDELNSALGVVRLHATPEAAGAELWDRIQSDLFVISAHLATPAHARDKLARTLATPLWDLPSFEADIDRLTALAPKLTHFVLPGGSPAAAYTHLARCICRRAERLVVALARTEEVPPGMLVYLNRLSDWLFALARAENALTGHPDVAWHG